MASSCSCHWRFLYVIPLLLLALAAFGGTIILAIFGIAQATESNPCVGVSVNNSCVPQTSAISASLVNESTPSPQMNVATDFNSDKFLYWMGGATGCGVLFAVICTFALWALEDAVYHIRTLPKTLSHQKMKGTEGTDMEMKGMGEDTDGLRSPTPPPPPKLIGTIGKHKVYERDQSDIRQMSMKPCSVVALFFSCFFFIISLLSMLWAIAIGLNHSNRVDITVVPFIIVEFLVAIIFPSLMFIAGVFMANVLDFITYGDVDARKGLPRFLNSVKFRKGTDHDCDYWIIGDTFYFPLEKRTDVKRREKGFCFSCYPNFATWILVAIVSLSVNLAISYFADITLDTQVSVNSCTDPRIDRSFSCFNSSTLAHVDCVEDTNVTLIHCFKFHRFGVDVDLIQSLATTYAFYLVATTVFGHLFVFIKVLLHLSKKHIWGIMFVILGVVLFIASVIIILVWLNGYISPAAKELSRLNVINLSQFVMVSWFVILIGLLMIAGKWGTKDEFEGKAGTCVRQGQSHT